MLSLALPLPTLILDGIVTPDFKAVLVYWRQEHTLAGHRAFSVHAKVDRRVDVKVLEDKHGPLPDKASEPNELRYKLSKGTADKASVDQAHYSWLLSRDLTNLGDEVSRPVRRKALASRSSRRAEGSDGAVPLSNDNQKTAST